MDAIENLFSLDYPSIIMGVFIIILGIDKVIFLLTKVFPSHSNPFTSMKAVTPRILLSFPKDRRR